VSVTPEEILWQMDEDVQILTLVQGTLADGGAHYAYVSIPPSKYMAFKQAEAKGNYNLRDFGKVLHHAKGKPSAEVQKQMAEQYGADHRFEEEINAMVAKMQAALKNAQ
jgi:hypothetical protein